jgi:hypothetical protein
MLLGKAWPDICKSNHFFFYFMVTFKKGYPKKASYWTRYRCVYSKRVEICHLEIGGEIPYVIRFTDNHFFKGYHEVKKKMIRFTNIWSSFPQKHIIPSLDTPWGFVNIQYFPSNFQMTDFYPFGINTSVSCSVRRLFGVTFIGYAHIQKMES